MLTYLHLKLSIYIHTSQGESQPNEDDGEVALENAYYNAKGERDAGEMDEAKATFESVVRMETNQNKKAAGVDVDTAEDDMDVDEGRKFKALKYHGSWSYKAIKQLVKLHIRALDGKSVMKDYTRMLCVAGSPDAAISPNALEKGVNGMLDRVSNIMTNPPSDVASDSSAHTLARDVYGTLDSDLVLGCILVSSLTLDIRSYDRGLPPENGRLAQRASLVQDESQVRTASLRDERNGPASIRHQRFACGKWSAC